MAQNTGYTRCPECRGRGTSQRVEGDTCPVCKGATVVTEETAFPLIRPEKVRGMRKWRQIIVVDGLDSPIKTKLIRYFKRKRWNQMAEKPYRR